MTALKLDENLPAVARQLLQTAGHDVETAQEEGLGGAPDDALLTAAIGEDRALVTLDLDFADVRRDDPTRTAGIIVLRLHDQTLPTILRAPVGLAGHPDARKDGRPLLESRRVPPPHLAWRA